MTATAQSTIPTTGIAPMGVKDWFRPFNEGRYVHPYAASTDEEKDPSADRAE
jgi:hypothetical protein